MQQHKARARVIGDATLLRGNAVELKDGPARVGRARAAHFAESVSSAQAVLNPTLTQPVTLKL